MTPPRPTAPTAAELREATIQMHCDSGAARILGTTPAAIVARARKVRK